LNGIKSAVNTETTTAKRLLTRA